MGILRFVIWTVACVGLGIFLATYEIGGRTPWKMAQSAWKDGAPQREKVKDEASDAVDGVKKKLAATTAEKNGPRETHSVEDRKAIEALISKRAN